MKGYKAFGKDWKCRDFQFEIGKTYVQEGELVICQNGFHFCKNPIDVFGYYPFSEDTKIAEVEALGEIVQEGTKYCTNKIRIIKEFTHKQLQALILDGKYNTGENNSGDWNSGNWNSGDWNSGNCNSGNRNSGNRNSGDWNSGNSNSGNWNSGDWNSGNWNSGNRNSGDWNSGNWNSGNRNSGFFNSTDATVRLFNHQTDMTFDEFYEACPCGLWGRIATKNLNGEDIEFIKNLPYFDADVFEKCTGIKIGVDRN